MKQLALILLFIATRLCANSQKDSSFQLIEDAIRSRTNVTKIAYLDSLIGFDRPFSDFIRENKLTGNHGDSLQIMSFTNDEIHSLDLAFKQNIRNSLRPNLFDNSTMLTFDSIRLFFNSEKGEEYFKKQYGRKYYNFSKVIFIRNSTIAIFRLAEMIGSSGGSDLLFVYLKSSNKWRQFLIFHMGAW